ncbi:MAG: N-acetylglucosamine-6-phosphate deacetylase [Chitinophagaceae bacterium]|nr:N-acetylglucosamine-6-phosphate deacetylase [Chitinophagaceae bacterium]
MSTRRLKIFNGSIICPYRIIPRGTIVVTGETITAVVEGDLDVPGAIEIDAQGNYISPGFIDIHVHGGGGHDFMDCNETAFLKIAETHARYGTTAMLPTTLSCERGELLTTLDIYKDAVRNNVHGAQFLGMHIEGPYFAMNQRGAQDPRYIRDPDPKEYRDIISRYDIIKRWSAAPELKGALTFAQYLKANNILPALAHTDATYEEVVKGFEHGYVLATHLYSGMSTITRRNAFRYAGALEASFLIEEMDVEVIADGRHVPAPLLQLALKMKGPGRIALITDAMRGAGMPEGESILGNKKSGLKVIVEDGVAKMPDRTSFAGSVATADRLVRTMIQLADVPLSDAVRMATSTPARIIGAAEKKGSLAVGKDADIVIFDREISVKTTIIKGEQVYIASSFQKKVTSRAVLQNKP